jgi:hypothetical protein
MKTKQKNIFGKPSNPKKTRDNSASNLLTRQVISLINWKYGRAYRIQKGVLPTVGGRFRPVCMENGLADVWACIGGRMVWIEIKIGKDKLSQDQLKQKELLERAGGIFIEGRSFEQIEKEIIEKCQK